MPKGVFTQADLTRAIKPALDLGLSVCRYEIDRNGKIVVFTSEDANQPSKNDWD